MFETAWLCAAWGGGALGVVAVGTFVGGGVGEMLWILGVVAASVLFGLALVLWLVARRGQKHVDAMFAGECLVHWRFAPDEWRVFLDAERAPSESAFARWIGVAAWQRRRFERLAALPAEVRIGRAGIYLCGEFWPFRAASAAGNALTFESEPFAHLVATFDTDGGTSSVVVPVPRGCEREAERVARVVAGW
jgi:hypothetical protein